MIVLEEDDEDEEPDFVAHLNIFDSSVKTQTSAADIESVQESVATKNPIMIRQTVLKELEDYRKGNLSVHKKTHSLIFWRDHKIRFPILAFLARKWLSVPAASTPSERCFSDCGIAIAAKKNRLGPLMLEEQMIIRKNEQYLKITKEEVIKHFLSKEKK